jgi:hypothetical protein
MCRAPEKTLIFLKIKGENQSPVCVRLSPIVPLAGRPDRRKVSRLSHLLINSSLTTGLMISLKGRTRDGAWGRVARRSLPLRQKAVTRAPGSARRARGDIEVAARDHGFMYSWRLRHLAVGKRVTGEEFIRTEEQKRDGRKKRDRYERHF